MTRNQVHALIAGGAALVAVLWLATPSDTSFKRPATWQRMANPGALSTAHAHLENDCAACHTPVRGVEATKCIACHASDERLLGRQPTSFHAAIGTCRECHVEHRGRAHRPTSMDHEALFGIGIDQLRTSTTEDHRWLAERLQRAAAATAPHARISSFEAALHCATCHANDDPHRDLFGANCAECHSTEKWSIPRFLHPSPSSTDCSQCHVAPPSHYMMHFHMISARVAGKPRARVDQCFECHQTTSWNDILGAGWYKHH